MKVIGIKFKDGGKIYYFAPKNNETYEEGMEVVVETSKSTEFAVVAFPPKDVPDAEVVQPLKPVVRIATNKDREQVKKNAERKPGAMKIAEEKIRKHNLDMKLIDCEFTFDGTKVIFYFAADRESGFPRVGQRSRVGVSYPHRTSSGGHPRRDEDFGRHRAVRQGMLLRGGASRVQKSFHQNGKGAGGCRSIPGRSAVFAAG